MPRHAHQDAVDEATFEQLLNATEHLDDPYDAECRLILLLGGRLGLRAGEITHLREDWVDWDRELIRTPPTTPVTTATVAVSAGTAAKPPANASERTLTSTSTPRSRNAGTPRPDTASGRSRSDSTTASTTS